MSVPARHNYEDRIRVALERLAPPVKCNSFGLEGPPCMGCPNDETCPILQPVTRAATFLEKMVVDLYPEELK